MATTDLEVGKIYAAKMEEEFRYLQGRLSARLSRTAFSRITWCLTLVGIMLICYSLYKIPNVQGGLPLPLNHEYLISFSVFSGIGILLHFFVLFLHLLASINEGNLKTQQQPRSLELLEKCFHRQNKLIMAIEVTEMLIFHGGSILQIYVFSLAVPSIFIPNVDPNSFMGTCFKQIEYSCYMLLILYKTVGFPTHWMFD